MEDRKMTEKEQERTIRAAKNYRNCVDAVAETINRFIVGEEICEILAREIIKEYPKIALSIIPEEDFKENILFNHYKGVGNGN